MLQELAVSEQDDEFGQKIRPYISQVQMVISNFEVYLFCFSSLVWLLKKRFEFQNVSFCSCQ